MRIGGATPRPYESPEEWLAQVSSLGYSAVAAPVGYDAPKEVKRAYLDCVRENDLVIGEVGIWRNAISPDEKERQAAMEFSRQQLALAEELGANCCVNIAGARGPVWDGCYAENYADDVYALIVDTVRSIIDSVQPKRTYFTLEPMPWMHPDSPDDYLNMIRDIDRERFAVHLDFANLINSMHKYLYSTAFITECYQKLAPYIKSVHAKDVALDGLPCRLRETNPGRGTVDFANVLRLTSDLGEDAVLFVEHMETYEEFRDAVAHLRGIAAREGIAVK